MKEMWLSIVFPASPDTSSSAPGTTLVRAPRQEIQADFGNHAVLADERHDVRQRADRRHLHEPGQPALAPGPAAERLDQLQRDANARQVLVGIRAVVAFGVDHGERGRQLGVGLVMIGDDEVDAEIAGAAARFRAANAAVHRDDERDTLGVQPIDRRRLQAVPVLHPLRDEVHDVGAEHLQRAPENHRRGDAVDVVVAVDGDALLARATPPSDDRREPHVGEQHRVVEVIEGGACGTRGGEPRVAEAALAEQPRDAGAMLNASARAFVAAFIARRGSQRGAITPRSTGIGVASSLLHHQRTRRTRDEGSHRAGTRLSREHIRRLLFS
jgi:hypothetical protein